MSELLTDTIDQLTALSRRAAELAAALPFLDLGDAELGRVAGEVQRVAGRLADVEGRLAELGPEAVTTGQNRSEAATCPVAAV